MFEDLEDISNLGIPNGKSADSLFAAFKKLKLLVLSSYKITYLDETRISKDERAITF